MHTIIHATYIQNKYKDVMVILRYLVEKALVVTSVRVTQHLNERGVSDPSISGVSTLMVREPMNQISNVLVPLGLVPHSFSLK